jgi:hypothetical protein
MSRFSRRSMMIVAGCALTLPLAAGTANAAFDIGGDGAAPADEVSASAESSLAPSGGSGSVDSTLGDGTVQVRGSEIPELSKRELPAASKLAADANGVVSRDGVDVQGSLHAAGEKLGGSADLSVDGGSLTVDTPIGNGTTNLETESVDIVVD